MQFMAVNVQWNVQHYRLRDTESRPVSSDCLLEYITSLSHSNSLRLFVGPLFYLTNVVCHYRVPCINSAHSIDGPYTGRWQVIVVRPQCIALNGTVTELWVIRDVFVSRLPWHDWVSISVKGKATPLQAWTGPEGSRWLRLSEFKIFGTWRW